MKYQTHPLFYHFFHFSPISMRGDYALLENNELKKDCQKLFKEGNTLEKSQVLTLLEAIRHYFGGNNAKS
ncbi:MAG: hypothetical protein WBI45_04605 [Defluviitoga tunisiensis]